MEDDRRKALEGFLFDSRSFYGFLGGVWGGWFVISRYITESIMISLYFLYISFPIRGKVKLGFPDDFETMLPKLTLDSPLPPPEGYSDLALGSSYPFTIP